MNEVETKAANTWRALRQFTPARVAIGRAGGSVRTDALLDFRLAHARARDALTRSLDEEKFVATLQQAGGGEIIRLRSAANDFNEYLLRPDLGRVLAPESITTLQSRAHDNIDLAVMVSEGLSTLAVETHAPRVLEHLFPLLKKDGWNVAPLCFIHLGRVAIQDHAGEILGARVALILLGERPGLVSPDSLGAYLVHTPLRGNTDAQRNCVSNISAHGLTPAQASAKLHWLLSESRRRQISGVELKDEFDANKALPDAP